MSDARDRLAASLREELRYFSGSPSPDPEALTDALLPVVQALVVEGAAKELRAAAEPCTTATWPYPIVGADGPSSVGQWLLARADALDPPK